MRERDDLLGHRQEDAEAVVLAVPHRVADGRGRVRDRAGECCHGPRVSCAVRALRR